MATLKPEPWMAQVLNGSVLVTGAPRSGTTLLGNLLHSCEGVEYLFEPKVVLPLLALLDNYPDKDDWRTLFETTLVAEAMMDRVAGRGINLNSNDESYIGNVKTPEWLIDRLAISWSAKQAQEVCERRILVWKSPEAGIWARDLRRLYPGMRQVAILREHDAVVRSMIAKGWFAGPKEARWFHQAGDMPFWWARRRGLGLQMFWTDLDEWNKASTLWHTVWNNLNGPGVYLVNYIDLCREPQKVFSSLCSYLGLRPGSMTDGLLSDVWETSRTKEV